VAPATATAAAEPALAAVAVASTPVASTPVADASGVAAVASIAAASADTPAVSASPPVSEITDVSALTTKTEGELGTLEWKMFFFNGEEAISPWHDIPLKGGENFNMVCEIPLGTSAKMEIDTGAPKNSIHQDSKKGVLRGYKYKGGKSIVNYGAFPQTWEDPKEVFEDTKTNGDNDPVDALEIGATPCVRGSVRAVKVIGALALIDGDETDWKVITIAADNVAADKLNTLADVDIVAPGKVAEIREWFAMYKTAEGKGENKYGPKDLDGADAVAVLMSTHTHWKALRSGARTME